jgi:hypothetical protein
VKLVPRVHHRERSPGALRPTLSTDVLSVLAQLLACANQRELQCMPTSFVTIADPFLTKFY